MVGFLDACRFNVTLGGTTDWTYSSAVTGYQSPAQANAQNGVTYAFRAESADLTQWEIATGAYNSSTGVFSRTTVLYNSAGTGTAAGQSGAGTKINFSAAPQVAIVGLAEHVANLTAPSNTFTGEIISTANGGANTAGFQAQSANPAFALEYTSGGADAKWWDWLAGSNILVGRAINDANSTATYFMQVNRSGYNIASVQIPVATSSTSTTSGAFQVSGGVGIGGNVHYGGTLSSNGSVGTQASLDAGGDLGVSISLAASGGTFQLANASSGFIFIQDDGTTGIIAIIALVNGQCQVVYQFNSYFIANTSSPSTSQIAVYYDGTAGRYTLKNGTPTAKNFYCMTMRIRPAN